MAIDNNNASVLIALGEVRGIAREVAEHTGRTVDAIQNANDALERAAAAGATADQLRLLRQNILQITTDAANLNGRLIAQDELAANGEANVNQYAENGQQATDEQLGRATDLLTAVQNAPAQAAGYTQAAQQAARDAEQLANAAAAERVIQMRQILTDAIRDAKVARDNAQRSVNQIQRQLNSIRLATAGAADRGLAQEPAQGLPPALTASVNTASRQIRERQANAERALETANQEVTQLEAALRILNAAPEALYTEEQVTNLRGNAAQQVTNATTVAATANTLATEVDGIAQPIITTANAFLPAPAASLMGGGGRTPTPTVTVDEDEVATQQNLSFAQFQKFLCLKMVAQAYAAETDTTKQAKLGEIRLRIERNNGTAAIATEDIQTIKGSSHHAYNGYKITEATNNGMTLKKKTDDGNHNFTLQFSSHGNNTRCTVSGPGSLVEETVTAAKMLIEASGPGSSNMVSLKLKDKTKLATYVSAMLHTTPPILAVQKTGSTADNIGAAMHRTHQKLTGELADQYARLCEQKQPEAWRQAQQAAADSSSSSAVASETVRVSAGGSGAGLGAGPGR